MIHEIVYTNNFHIHINRCFHFIKTWTNEKHNTNLPLSYRVFSVQYEFLHRALALFLDNCNSWVIFIIFQVIIPLANQRIQRNFLVPCYFKKTKILNKRRRWMHVIYLKVVIWGTKVLMAINHTVSQYGNSRWLIEYMVQVRNLSFPNHYYPR